MSECTGESEFAELMTDHIFGYINRNEDSAIVDRDGVLEEIGIDGGTSAPSLDDFLLASFILLLNLFEELRIAIRSFLQ